MTDAGNTKAAASSPHADQVKRALAEIRGLRARLADAERMRSEPVAVVGVGLRLPGEVADLDGFAELLWAGRDVIELVPPERWRKEDYLSDDPDAPGCMTTAHGSFLKNVDLFDPEFFGISDREALSMDPQQRLLLETAWEALENAGHAPNAYNRKALGVYLGISTSDYGRRLFSDVRAIDPYFASGVAYSVAAGRISYVLGAQGPAVSIDTACSSSLVALHLACQGLRLGECDTALVGGVNLMLTPETHVNFSKAGMLALDGRCKTFDAGADGYVRGEGCVQIVLRRLSDALADQDRILAVVRGSAVNQDGRSNGLTAPNGPAQAAVIRSALASAGVSPDAVGYVEAHGTGTSLGDPIEVGALGEVFGPGRDPSRPLLVGSVKTNLGHLEAAAGLAGLLKAIVALQAGRIPQSLHFTTPNPHIDWRSAPVRVADEAVDWPRAEAPRVAGVSSFGFSGTNAHVVLEEAPAQVAQEAAGPAERSHQVLTLSARSETALDALTQSFADAIGVADSIGDACFTANSGRAHFAHRLAAVAEDAAGMAGALAAAAQGRKAPAVVRGRARPEAPPRIGFLFTGQGAQHPGMGRALYDSAPAFRDALDACAAELGDALPGGLLETLFAPEESSRIHDARITQPALFAIEYALDRLWRSWGVKPHIVAGHSLGEIAAACSASVLTLSDALKVVTARGRLTSEVEGDGAMAAVFAEEATIAAAIEQAGSDVVIAAYNGPKHHVLSGPRVALEAVTGKLEGAGVRVEPLRVSFAAHSAQVDALLPAFGEALAGVHLAAPAASIVSSVTGRAAGAEEIATAEHWVRHLREPVRFAQAVQSMLADGITHFVEIGPHPVLSGMAAECEGAHEAEFLPSLRRDGAPWAELCESVGRLFVAGAEIDFAAFDEGRARRRIALPSYPFERRSYWLDVAPPAAAGADAQTRWRRVSRRLDHEAERAPLALGAASYPAKWDALARLTRALIVSLFREAGLFATPGETRDVEAVRTALGAQEGFAHLIRRWLDKLVDAGELTRTSEGYSCAAALTDPELAARRAEVEAHLADNTPLGDYVLHCADVLGGVIRGEISPLETLFPGGDFNFALGLYERSATMRYMNDLAAAAVEAVADASAPGLAVLEIGAGTGGTTAAVLEALTDRDVRYHFTDVSEAFLERAGVRFADCGLSYGLFDLDKEIEEQGYEPESFDLILSSNAVHAVRDLRAALPRLRSLLRPGGVLALVESTTHFDWFDISTGLIEGWRHAADDLRTDVALIPADVWITALTDAGFETADAWPRATSDASAVGQHLVLARAPGDAAPVAAPIAHASSAPSEKEVGKAEPEIAAAIDAMRAAPAAERPAALAELVRLRVMEVLRRSSDNPPEMNERLLDLGLDSLMAVQLRNALAADLALPGGLPATLVFDHPTIAGIAAFIDKAHFSVAADEEGDGADGQDAHEVRAKEIAEMTDEEAEALLLKRLSS